MPATANYAELSSNYLHAQLSSNRREAIRLLIDDGFNRGASVPSLLLDVIQPAQREIGRLWQENRISIADEHLATAISQVALAHLYQLAPRGAALNRRILVACVEGERHDMGARVLSDLLDFEGFDVFFLGADVPVSSLVDKALAARPDLVVLSMTMTFHQQALRRSVAAIRRELPSLPIAGGGHAFGWCPELARELSLTLSGTDARELVSDVRDYLDC
jgi:methanogenic corrinoid protein MtbC1